MMLALAKHDLQAEIEAMRRGAHRDTHTAKTLLHSPELRLVLMLLDRGTEIPAHRADGAVTIHVLEGHVWVAAGDDTYELRPSQILALEPTISHAVAATEDSAILLTIAWRGARAST